MTLPATSDAIRTAYLEGHLRARDVCDEVFARLAERDPALHCFVAHDETGAAAAADALDARHDRQQAGPLAAVPVAVKDNLCTRGMATTAGARALQGFVPPYDATVVSRLRSAGALIVGKTNCDEFAMGASTEFSAWGPTRNPWRTSCTPGGSSGGSAAAVAARLVPSALGSDTGGSVRQPAGFCGVVGIRPTYGRVSRFGLIAFASSLDQVGTFGLTVRDAATLLAVIAGPDQRDATCHAVCRTATALPGPGLAGLRVGIPARWLDQGIAPGVMSCFRDAVAVLRTLGATLVEIELPHAELAIPVYYLLAAAEASSNLARYDGIRYGHRGTGGGSIREWLERTRHEAFGAEVKRRILLGTHVLSAGYAEDLYVRALKVRTVITRSYETALASVDVLATPTSPTTAFALGERTSDPLQMYLADVFTAGAPLAGLPALSIPCGFAPDGLPVGLHLVGRRFDDDGLVGVAEAYEHEQPWWTACPPGLSGSVA